MEKERLIVVGTIGDSTRCSELLLKLHAMSYFLLLLEPPSTVSYGFDHSKQEILFQLSHISGQIKHQLLKAEEDRLLMTAEKRTTIQRSRVV